SGRGAPAPLRAAQHRGAGAAAGAPAAAARGASLGRVGQREHPPRAHHARRGRGGDPAGRGRSSRRAHRGRHAVLPPAVLPADPHRGRRRPVPPGRGVGGRDRGGAGRPGDGPRPADLGPVLRSRRLRPASRPRPPRLPGHRGGGLRPGDRRGARGGGGRGRRRPLPRGRRDRVGDRGGRRSRRPARYRRGEPAAPRPRAGARRLARALRGPRRPLLQLQSGEPGRRPRRDALAAHRRRPLRRHVPPHRARRGDRASATHRPRRGRPLMTPTPTAQLTAVTRKVAPAKNGNTVALSQTFDAAPEQLWEALTTAERLVRWFGTASGDVVPGGRYELPEMETSGRLVEVEPPHRLLLTWEFGKSSSDLELLITPAEESAEGAGGSTLTLRHTVPADAHWATFGPGATGCGWD